MNGKLLILLCASILAYGCESLIKADRILNSTPTESYDHGICNSGEPSKPGEDVRSGCVNNRTEEQNRQDYNYYKTERDLYLNEQ